MDLERTMGFILEQQVASAAAQSESHARMARIEEDLAKSIEIGRRTREELRRAVRLSVQEARTERKRRKEEDARLAASQEELRKSLQSFIDSMKQPRNGHDQN